jgi:hypothetical protein
MRNDWYYSGPEGQRGPVSLQQLKATLAAHPTADDLYIWHESLSEWIRAGDVAEVFADANPFADTRSAGQAEYRHSRLSSLLLGLLVLISGGLLFYLGISGNVTRLVGAFGLPMEIVDASPGALLFIVGLLVIWGRRDRVAAKQNFR